MGRRRRKKVVKVVRRRLPKYFVCPRCGGHSVKVSMGTGADAKIQCSQCGLTGELPVSPPEQTVDVYCRFTDLFYAGKIS